MTFVLVEPGHPLRDAAETRIRSVFQRQYGAAVRTIPHNLAALLDTAGTPTVVAGVRFGSSDWACQCYLDQPLDQELSRLSNRAVGNEQILEVSGLASVGLGASFKLIRGIIEIGRQRGQNWGVFTATKRLRQVIAAAHLPLLELSPAVRTRIDQPDDWGSYYDTDPWVCALPDDAAAPLQFSRNRARLH